MDDSTSLDMLELSNNNNTTVFPFNMTDDAWNLTSEEEYNSYVAFRDQSRFWVQRVLLPTLAGIGLLGNIATIIIMTRPRMRSSTNYYLAALAFFDLLYLLSVFILSLSHYPNFKDQNYALYWNVWPYVVTITDASSNTSVWLTVTFTIERYIAVCHPMKGKVLCTESRARKMIALVLVACFLVTLPTLFEWTIREHTDPVTNITVYRPDFSTLGRNETYQSVYYWIIAVCFTFSPLVLLTIFNAFLIRSVRSSRILRRTMTQMRRDSSDSNSQERKITIMLIAVVVLFILCQLPTACTLLYNSFHTATSKAEEALLRGLGNIFNFLMTVNAAGNFVLYSLLSQKYRRTFLQTFCPCLKGKIHRLHSVYQNTVYTTVEGTNSSETAGRTPRFISLNTMRLPPAWRKPFQTKS